MVNYRWNKNAWMTNVIFNEWLSLVNKKYKALNRKILLFVDNFSGHSFDQSDYDCIKIQFFPPNLTSIVQPLDQGIINAFKVKYRKQIVNDKLEAINTNSKMLDIQIINGINYTVQAWSEVSALTIRNCFRKAGFNVNQFLGDCSNASDDKTEIDKTEMENLWTKIKRTETGIDFSYFEYVEVDKNLISFETYSEESIVQNIIDERNLVTESSDDEDELSNHTENIDSNTAKVYLQKLMRYFQANKDDCTEFIDNLLVMITCINNQVPNQESK